MSKCLRFTQLYHYWCQLGQHCLAEGLPVVLVLYNSQLLDLCVRLVLVVGLERHKMATSAVYTCGWLLAAATLMHAVLAIGPCNNTLVNDIMAANAQDCPTDVLERVSASAESLVSFTMPYQLYFTITFQKSYCCPIVLRIMSGCLLDYILLYFNC